MSSVGSEQADISFASPPRADTLGASARPITRSLCMSTALWIFLLSFLILVKVVADPGACADLLLEKDGFLLCKKDTAAAACKSEATVVFASTWCSAAIEHPASADPQYSQQAPFKGSHVLTSSPCGLQRHHGAKATILALCSLSCCDERYLPQMLEVWPGVGTVQRSILYSSRSTWTSLQSAPSATSTLGWPAVAQFKLWFLESEDTHKALIQSRTEKGEGQRYLARWRPNESSQRTRQRYGATCTSTDTIAAFYAVSAHDAPVPAADDAGTAATTLDRQGCWQNKEFSCDDAHDAGGTTRSYDICCTDHAMGYSRTDDGTTSGTDRVFGYEFCGDIDWAQTGWTSTAKVEQIAQGDEEGRRQSISSSTSHRSRDAETRREKQYQKLVLCSQSPGRCQAGPARSRKCTGSALVAMEVVPTTIGGEIVVTHPNVGDFSEEKNKCMMSSEV